MPDFIGPLPPSPVGAGSPPNLPTLPPNGPTVLVNNYPTPTLPGWVAPTQSNNPSSYDINAVGNSLSERILTLSPWGTYVPVIYGTEYVGPILTLITQSGSYLYLRLVWCVGEVDSIVSITQQGGINAGSVIFTNYTGTSGQGIDPTLAGIIPGYADTLTNVGPDNLNLCYSVAKLHRASYDSFPRFVAKIKGLKIPSPVPTIESVDRGAAQGSSDTVTLAMNTVTASDISDNGVIGSFIRYYEDELIDNDSYTFEIEVLEYNDRGTGTAAVFWAETALLDSDTNPVVIDGVGSYIGSASRSTYDGTYNALKIIINGDAGVSMVYSVKAYNTLGNTVTKYHETAGIALNHLITDESIGLGLTSNYASLVDLIHRNNEVLETVGYSERRSAIGIALTNKRNVSQVIEVLRGYARTNINNINGEVVYYPLQPVAESFTITNSDIKPGTWKPSIKDLRDVPNLVRVYYTDLTPTQPRDNYVELMTPEVEAATEKKREVAYRMPGYRSRPAALRFGYDVLNQRLRKFACTFKTHQKVYDQHEGETFTLDIDELDNVPYKMKIVTKKQINVTEYEIYAEQEDDDIYSNEIADYDPASPILIEDDPYNVLDASNLDVAIETSLFQTAIYFSRFRVTWDVTEYQYNHSYIVRFYEDSTDTLIEEKYMPQGQSETILNNIQENIEYRIELNVLGFGGTMSTGLTIYETPTGKDFPPTDVPSFIVSQTLGTVTCSWTPAADNQQVWYYEIQFGPADFEWNDANARLLVTRIDAYEFISQFVPSGAWDFLIKAVDNAYNQSENATRFAGVEVVDLPDLLDLGATYPTINETDTTNMVPFVSNRLVLLTPEGIDSGYYDINDWATDTGNTWAEMFPNAMNTYTTGSILTYGDGVSGCVLYSTASNAGQVIDGIWSIETTISEGEVFATYYLEGGDMVQVLTPENPPVIQLESSINNSTWFESKRMTISGLARYTRWRITSPNAQSRWIYRAGGYPIRTKAKIKTEYANIVYNSETNDIFLFERETRNLQFSAVSIAQNSAYTVTHGPINDVADILGLVIVVYDDEGSEVIDEDVNLNIIARYI